MPDSANSPIRSALRAGIVFAAALGGGALFVVMLWMHYGGKITNAREEYVITLARETLGDGYPPPVFAARRDDLPSARIVALACINDNVFVIRGAAKGGYGGDIEFVVSFINGTTGGIRIIRHRETPGIADFLDTAEGGKKAMDGVAGATITSGAMTKAIAAIIQWQKREQPCGQNTNGKNQ